MVSVCLEPAKVTMTSLFPNTVTSPGQSVKVVAKLLAAAVSNIAYARFTFPEESFRTVDFDGLQLKMLNADAEYQPAKELANAVRSAICALRAGHLKQVMFLVKSEDLVFETYKFQFGPKESADARAFDPQSLQNRSIQIMGNSCLKTQCRVMLRHILIATSSLGELPLNTELAVIMEVYDHTPKDYEPGEFRREGITLQTLKGNLTTLNLGEVRTQWDSMGAAFGSMDFDATPKVEADSVAPTRRLLMYKDTSLLV